MQEIIERIIEKTEEKMQEKEFVEKHKRREADFTRKRNLSFEEIVKFVIGNAGTSMDFEVMNFCGEREEEVSGAAISKGRDKIKSSAFEEIFIESAKEVPVKEKHKGYRVTSYDGMVGELPRTKELMEAGKVNDKGSYPQFHMVAEYDVLNCCYTNAVMKVGASDERKAAVELIEKHSYEGKEILLVDRGFPSVKLIQILNESGKKYVMRVSKSFLKEVNEFGGGKSKDKVVKVEYDKRRGATSRVKDVELPYSFKLRCVKIDLPSETEVLITNLDKNEFSREELGELYNLRWKIETSFLHLKYAVRIEDFLGVKENSIRQEFFASLFKSNLFMQFIGAANHIITFKKNSKKHLQG